MRALTEHLAEIGIVEIGILVGQFLALDLCPDHERVHRATYPLLLEAPLSLAAAGMAHLHSCGNRRDALLIFQRRPGSQPGHVLQPLLRRRTAQHARYLVSGNCVSRNVAARGSHDSRLIYHRVDSHLLPSRVKIIAGASPIGSGADFSRESLQTRTGWQQTVNLSIADLDDDNGMKNTE